MTMIRVVVSTGEAARMIARLRIAFNLVYLQLGFMLGVDGESVWRWEGTGTRGQPRYELTPERFLKLREATVALERLEEMFPGQKIRDVVRERSRLFDNKTALDLILRGGILGVVQRYEEERRTQWDDSP